METALPWRPLARGTLMLDNYTMLSSDLGQGPAAPFRKRPILSVVVFDEGTGSGGGGVGGV